MIIDLLITGVEGLVELWPWKRRVPDVRGMDLEECRLAIERVDLVLEVRSDARAHALVTSQQPDPGTRVKARHPVLVTVEKP